MENITHRRVIQNHHFAQIRLHLSQVFDICAIPERAVLAVVAAGKVLSFSFQPIDDRVCVLLHRSCEDYQVVPFAHFPQEVMASGSFVNVVENGHAGADLHARAGDWSSEPYFDHVTC